MARVTADEVREIFETDLVDTNLNAFITVANLLVTDLLVGVGYADELLKEIERWWSAHLAAQMDPVAEAEKIGDSNIKYALAISRSEKGLGLNNTPYGQQVKTMDYLGILAEIGKRSAVIETAFEAEEA